jgi:hypothetical protein
VLQVVGAPTLASLRLGRARSRLAPHRRIARQRRLQRRVGDMRLRGGLRRLRGKGVRRPRVSVGRSPKSALRMSCRVEGATRHAMRHPRDVGQRPQRCLCLRGARGRRIDAEAERQRAGVRSGKRHVVAPTFRASRPRFTSARVRRHTRWTRAARALARHPVLPRAGTRAPRTRRAICACDGDDSLSCFVAGECFYSKKQSLNYNEQ